MHGFLRLEIMKHLPWHARLSLEKFTNSERAIPSLPKRQTVEKLVSNILDKNNINAMEAMLVPIIEKADVHEIREMILQTALVENLAKQLQHISSYNDRIKSEAIFVLMKLGSSGGEPCIRKILKFNIVKNLIFFDALQVTRIARYNLHSTSSADTWRERKMLFNRVVETEFCSIFPVLGY